jgi:peptidoglycan/LPS O-acetylase OafA/YrhL
VELNSSLPRHDARLQSLRGLAALAVLFGHASLVLQPTLFSTIEAAIFQQDSAVIFFYVLSGFVLGQSLQRDPRFWPFAWRRLTRLLPVMWASIVLGATVATAMRGATIADTTPWFDYFSHIDTGPSEILRNFLAVSVTINGSMWSIQIELAMIAVLPFAVPVLWRLPLTGVLVGACAICAVSDGLLLPLAFQHPALRVFAYAYCFYIGVILPRVLEIKPLRPLIESAAAVGVELAIFIAMYLLFRRGLFLPSTMYVINALISAHIVGFVASSHEHARWLLHRWLVWLGDRSYSFYAYGQIVLVGCAFFVLSYFPGGWPTRHPAAFTAVVLSLSLGILIPLAGLSFRWIEIPGMRLGNLFRRKRGGDKKAAVPAG